MAEEKTQTIYLTEKICMNRGFPFGSESGIEPYHFVKTLISYEVGPTIESDSLSGQTLKDLKQLQDTGTRLVSGIAYFPEIVEKGDDLEIYNGILNNRQGAERLKAAGIELIVSD